MLGKKNDKDDQGGQVSETSMMTPEGGAGDTPGTEDGTPAAADIQHAPHEGPKDYTKGPEEQRGERRITIE